MKYNWQLEYLENQKAWEEYRGSAPRTDFSDLATSERLQLQALNEQLRQLEEKFYHILRKKDLVFSSRVTDPSDWLDDFNLSLWLTFYLREDDPEWEEDCDNILTQHQCSWRAYSGNDDRDWGFGASAINHAEFPENYPGEHHCWSYHQLTHHSFLDWLDLFRIERIEIEIKCDEQGYSSVPG